MNESMKNQTPEKPSLTPIVIILTIILTAVIVGSSIFLWQNNQTKNIKDKAKDTELSLQQKINNLQDKLDDLHANINENTNVNESISFDENTDMLAYNNGEIKLEYSNSWILSESPVNINWIGIAPPNPSVENKYFTMEWKAQIIEDYVNEYNNPAIGAQIDSTGTIDLNGTIGYKYSGTSSLGNVQKILFTSGSVLYIIDYGYAYTEEINNIIESITLL